MATLRRSLLLGSLTGVLAAGAAQAQRPYPDAPVRIIVPYAPGGGSDVLARLIAPGMQTDLGQSVIVENRPGAGSQLGAEAVMRSRPDGLTLLLADTPLTTVPSLQVSAGRPAPFDPSADFAPISLIGDTPMGLYTHPAASFTDFNGLVAEAKAHPDRISVASAGIGTVSHLLTLLMQERVGIQLVHVPYRGGAPAMQDLAAGQVQLGFTGPATALPMVRSGLLRALAVTSLGRQAMMPTVPTFRELQVDLVVTQWYGLLTPAGVPQAIIDRLAASVAKAMEAPTITEQWLSLGMNPRSDGPSVMRDVIRSDTAVWAQVIRNAGVRVE